MMTAIVAAALRSLALAVMVWFGIAALLFKNQQNY
jgi:hypothetical protein